MRVVYVIFALVLFAGIGCTKASSPEDLPPGQFQRINEVEGTYGGVGIGSSNQDVWRVFGEKAPAPRNAGLQPTGAGDGFFGPTSLPARRGYRYEDVAFWFPLQDVHLGRGSPHRGKQDEVGGFQVTARGAVTLRGIQAGDSLAEARAAYPELECRDAPAGDVATYPACAGRIAEERHIWFGGDPIVNISVSRSPM